MRTFRRLSAAALLLSTGGVAALGLCGPLLAQEPPAAEPPQVLRGSAIGPAEARGFVAAGPGFEVAAGEDLWLIDRAGARLFACELVRTARVGREEIRCQADDLPERLTD